MTQRAVPGAPRTPDGVFHNPWPRSEPHGLGDVARMLGEQRTEGPAPTPPRGSFPTASPIVAYPRAPDTTFTATWVGHSTVLLQVGGLNILTDPVFSQRAFPVQWAGPRRVMDPGLPIERLPPIDVVLQSHNHYDHLDRPAVRRIAATHPGVSWIVPLGVGSYIRRWGAKEIVELDWWQETEVKGLHVTATPARHFSGRTPRDRNRSLWGGFAFSIGRHRALFVGDTAYHPEFEAIGARCGPFDLVMMPIGAYDPRWFMSSVHVDPAEALAAFQELIAAHSGSPLPVMLAIHWGTFRLTREPMDEPPKLARDVWRRLGLSEDRLWIARFGETRILIP